ncbi:MAG TPA: VanZ family protein [Ignavibacteriaceae bacterium]
MFNYLERHKILLVYLPLIFYWIILFTLTTLPTHSVPSVGVNDKVEHLLAYFGLSFLLYLTLLFQKKSIILKNYAVLFTFLAVFAYGIMDEVHQLLIPGRSCELLDFLADMFGGVVGIVVLKILIKFYKYQEQTAS